MLLRWKPPFRLSERTRQVGYLLFSGVLNQGVGILTTVMVARYMPVDEYGAYRQLFLVHGMLLPAFSMALPTSVLYFLGREKDHSGRQRFVTQTVLVMAILGVAMSVTLAAGAPLLARLMHSPSLLSNLVWFSPFAALELTVSYFVPSMVAIGKARLSALFSTGSAILKSMALVCAVLFSGKVPALLAGLLISASLSLTWALYLTKKNVGFSELRIDLESAKAQLKYSFPLGMASLVSIWGLKLDQFVVSISFTPAVYALYDVGSTEVPLTPLLQGSINSVLLPAMAQAYGQGNKDEMIRLWQSALNKTSRLVLPVFALLLVVSPDLIVWAFSDQYLGSIPVFRTYLFLMPLRIATFGLFMRSIGKTHYDLWGAIGFLIVNVVLALAGIRLLGLLGPAIAMVLSLAGLTAYQLTIASRELSVSIGRLVPWRLVLEYSLLCALAGGVTVATSKSVNIDVAFWRLVVQTLIFGITYLVLYLGRARHKEKQQGRGAV